MKNLARLIQPTETTEVPTTSQTSSATVASTIISTTSTTQMPIILIPPTTAPTSTPSPTPEPEATTVVITTTTPVSTTTTSTTTTSIATPRTTSTTTTEKIEYGVRNFPPRKDKRLQKIAAIAGKPLSYIIPADAFSDVEDGNTTQLKLSLYLQGSPVKSSHWLQLNSDTQEIYGL